MSDFAKAQLLKYGWSEGKGLGKNETGIKEAIKPKLKFDTTGIGHKDSDYEWWNCIYNKAANNIKLNNKSDDVSISVSDKNAFNISSKKNEPHKKSTLYHGKFLKTSTLQDGSLIKDNTCQDDVDDTSDEPFVMMTDDELFKACGGRTAHKGARHGLTLSGKLSRVAEQERQLLADSKSNSCSESAHCNRRKKEKKKKTKKKKVAVEAKDPLINDDIEDPVIPFPLQTDKSYTPSKKTAKKVRRKIHDLTHRLSKSCNIEDDSLGDDETSNQDTSEDNTKQQKNRRKRKIMRMGGLVPNVRSDTKRKDSLADALEDTLSLESNVKKRKKNLECSELASALEEITESTKKNKKKRKEKSINKTSKNKFKNELKASRVKDMRKRLKKMFASKNEKVIC